MTVPTGTRVTYNEPIATGGNREDLSDMLWDVSPTDTPFITAAGKNNATATNHEWLTDVLEAQAANAAIEGDNPTGANPASRVRLGNYTQILTKTALVSGTQEKVLKGGGIKSEMAYQVARRMKAIKRDAEGAFVGAASQGGAAKAVGSASVARRMGSFVTYQGTTAGQVCWAGGTTPTAPTYNGATMPVQGTARALDVTILNNALQVLYTNSGGNENILGICGPGVRSTFSKLVGAATRYVSTDDKNLVNSIDVYNGDFHTVTISPDRFSDAGNLYLIDPEYVKVSELRPLFTKDLGITGDATQKELIWETTLEVCNPIAHFTIAALT